ncbi:hypothetical protein ABGB18_36950 [Nonomuraea sp. B12E4]|uniref:hypothetical protein n=1 Tax=Nonomuraea sp. B12E4 TaxID=3153564 RepID=UPI00325C912B
MADQLGFQARHFSLNNPRGEEQDNVPNLLRRLASTIEGMGKIEIRDLVFHNDTDDDGDPWPFVTIYFDYVQEDEGEDEDEDEEGLTGNGYAAGSVAAALSPEAEQRRP